MRARLTGLVLLAVLGVTTAPDAAWTQVPGVGPGHCVSGCGGGSSLGRGGGSRGGGMGGAAGAIGSAIGIGMAIGSAAAQQQQQQQAKEKSSARKEDSPRKVSHARESKPEKRKTDQADKPKEAKQPDTKQAKLTEPSKNSNWSGCTGKVGTVWNAGNCGHPTMPTTPTSSSSTPQLHRIPYFVPIVPTRFVDSLPCPLGFEEAGTTFYGGRKCAPTARVADLDLAAQEGKSGPSAGPKKSRSDPSCSSIKQDSSPQPPQWHHDPADFQAIVNDPNIKLMIENAWAASRPDDKCAAAAVNTRACRTHEVHFWIIQNNATKELAISHWAESDTPETASGVREGLPPIIPGFTTVAGFHTHPFTPAQGYNPSKRSAADILNSASEFRNLPSIIKYYDGCFYYGPPLPPDFIKPVPPSEARN